MWLVRTPVVDYASAWQTQQLLADAHAQHTLPGLIWLLEHPPVYTVGRHGVRSDLFLSDEMLATMGAQYHQVDRGGQMTWHGPGQTTGYVIRRLGAGESVRGFVTALLEAMAEASGLPGVDIDHTAMGVYVRGRKLGSVGIRVRQRVTYHGVALNRDPDMEWFRMMTACGAPGVEATSIAQEGGDPDRARVEQRLGDLLARHFGATPQPTSLDEVLAQSGVASPA